MNVFVLCTGRSGSKTFFRACSHMINYTAGHESKVSEVGEQRLLYPNNHIEIDNRLSWLLGRLEKRYGDEAFYVHLVREKTATAKSFNKRWIGKSSIIRAYAEGVLSRRSKSIRECMDYYETVNSNIRLFLKDKSRVMRIRVNEAEESFPTFWKSIGAKGDLDKALKEFSVHHNRSDSNMKRLTQYSVWRVKNLFR